MKHHTIPTPFYRLNYPRYATTDHPALIERREECHDQVQCSEGSLNPNSLLGILLAKFR